MHLWFYVKFLFIIHKSLIRKCSAEEPNEPVDQHFAFHKARTKTHSSVNYPLVMSLKKRWNFPSWQLTLSQALIQLYEQHYFWPCLDQWKVQQQKKTENSSLPQAKNRRLNMLLLGDLQNKAAKVGMNLKSFLCPSFYSGLISSSVYSYYH